MPDVWAPDDLRFALSRAAHLEPPRQVVSDLLAAADQPAARLAGVTAFQARLRAAEVLLEVGQRGEGVMVLREAVQEAGPGRRGATILPGSSRPWRPRKWPWPAAAPRSWLRVTQRRAVPQAGDLDREMTLKVRD
ncbi:MAG TPA: hypothetical protein VHY31_25370 [Streptosporangiaceae bacterium]|jgi:hypothetical protein|nr:hypothetical protein [Streptosporangiaceae bacterium]